MFANVRGCCRSSDVQAALRSPCGVGRPPGRSAAGIPADRGLQNVPGGGEAAMSGHLLVLDDDPTVTDVVRRYLKHES